MTATLSGPQAEIAVPVRATAVDRAIGWILTVGGALGAAAAFILAVEKIRLLTDASYTPSCSINPVLSCGSVMVTWQAEVFGFPNPLLGVLTFPIVVTLGVLTLARVPLPRWVWLGLQAGLTFAVVFVHWLMFASLYRIGALCPYCMVVWVVVVALFWYTTLHNLDRGRLQLPGLRRSAVNLLAETHAAGPALWVLTVVVLIAQAFWDQWMIMMA
ncbi:vitamin K epoxide reductase family protein [Catellatospora sp. NPDC049111]|uniref:vitamin K epoxide reductase family protein n=1 Tax=Catellatospora sp. NPDC049111 TaxID=3155271 RepID=UPI0033D478A5